MKRVKVIIWGLGAIGSGIAEMLLEKKGVDIVGVAGRGSKLGKSMYDYLPVGRGGRPDVIIGIPEEVIKEKAADVVLCCTDSSVISTFDKAKFVLERKINFLSSAEEMVYPKAQHPHLAAELDKIAKENGVSILGTGINPGLIMDLLVIVMTGCCKEIEQIVARRVNGLSSFGPTVMQKHGIGLPPDEFRKDVKSMKLSGHVGFHESIHMIADAVGWEVDEVIQTIDPIITDVDRKSRYGSAEAGSVAGSAMKGFGFVGGTLKIGMDHPQQIEPEKVGVQTGDYVIIKGIPNINMTNIPAVPGYTGAIAMCVNMIPHVINASPGLHTMIDLPVPRAILGDMRTLICKDAKIVE